MNKKGTKSEFNQNKGGDNFFICGVGECKASDILNKLTRKDTVLTEKTYAITLDTKYYKSTLQCFVWDDFEEMKETKEVARCVAIYWDPSKEGGVIELTETIEMVKSKASRDAMKFIIHDPMWSKNTTNLGAFNNMQEVSKKYRDDFSLIDSSTDNIDNGLHLLMDILGVIEWSTLFVKKGKSGSDDGFGYNKVSIFTGNDLQVTSEKPEIDKRAVEDEGNKDGDQLSNFVSALNTFRETQNHIATASREERLKCAEETMAKIWLDLGGDMDELEDADCKENGDKEEEK